MADAIDANLIMATLRAELEMLAAFINDSIVQAKVYEIPFYDTGEVPDEIVPVAFSGKEAEEKAKRAYKNMSRAKKQKSGNVFRLPGVVVVNRDVKKVVDKVNKTKTQLKAFLMEEYPIAKERHQFTRTEFKGRVMLQAYRKVNYVSESVESVGFSWMPRTEVTTRYSRAKALAMLNDRRVALGSYPQENARLAIEIALEHVMNSSAATEYVVKRPRAPYPTAVLHHTSELKGRETNKKFMSLSTPVIIGPCKTTIKIGELKKLNTKVERNVRKDKIKVESVYKPSYLYQVLK